MTTNQGLVNNFELEIKSVLNCNYIIDPNHSRSSYSATCSEMVSIPLSDDNGITKKQIAWEFDLLQKAYEVNVVARKDRNSRIIWIGKGSSAKEAYANLTLDRGL
jgi:hypothetical protein